MKINKLFIILGFVCWIIFSGCSKLQDGYDYHKSFYNTDVKMNVMDFMKSRPDLFTGMLAAIDYVDADPNRLIVLSGLPGSGP